MRNVFVSSYSSVDHRYVKVNAMISVLYVDDDPDLLEIARLFLMDNKDFSVDCALSGKDALDQITSGHYDAVVSDYQMPKMDGITLLKTVRATHKKLPFILFTGKGREEIVIDALNSGADFYLQKGGEPESQFTELSHKIRQAVQQRLTEKNLHDRERREADILNFLPDATFAVDTNGVVIAWNRAIEEMTGIPAREMIGKGDHEYAIPFYGARRPILIDLIFSPEQEVRQNYSFVSTEGDILTAETTNASLPGKNVILWAKAVPLYDTRGTVIGAIESIRDITERKHLEAVLEEKHGELQNSYEELTLAKQKLCSQFDQLAERERALEINEERLRMAQEIGHTGCWEYNLAANTIWGSAEGLRIFGYPPAAGNFPVADIEACIQERDRAHQALVDLITGGKEYNIEYLIHPADGSAPKMIRSIARLEKDAGGSPLKVLGVIHDITERTRAEGENWNARQILEGILNSIHVRVFWKDRNLVYLGCNTSFAQDAGFEKSGDIIGRDDYAMGWREQADRYRSDDRAVIESRMPRLFIEEPQKTPSGTTITLLTTKIPLHDAEGNVMGVLGTYIDITERKRAEEALRESQHKLAEAMDLAHLVNWEYDITTGCFTFDDRFYALYGTTAEREGGVLMTAETYAREFVYPEDRGMVADEVEKALQTTDPRYVSDVEHRIIRRDGDVRHIVVRIRITKDAEGRTIKTHGVNQDITERKKSEEALRLANRQLTLLNGITRHDIINKITVFLGYLKIAEKKCKDPALTEYLAKMRTTAAAIKSQIEFTRIYQDLGTHEPQWLELDVVMPRSLVPAPVALIADIRGISVRADPMLEKVFSNLLENSIRHGEHVTEIRVSSHRSGGNLVLVWEDNGIGIATGEKEQIFERGFGKNTGLGMFIAREILSLTGITITETGVPCKGARFEITVPEGAYRITGEQ